MISIVINVRIIHEILYSPPFTLFSKPSAHFARRARPRSALHTLSMPPPFSPVRCAGIDTVSSGCDAGVTALGTEIKAPNSGEGLLPPHGTWDFEQITPSASVSSGRKW